MHGQKNIKLRNIFRKGGMLGFQSSGHMFIFYLFLAIMQENDQYSFEQFFSTKMMVKRK